MLSLLPASTRIDQLFKFFEKSIRESNKTKHMDMVVKNLLKAERLQVQSSLRMARRCYFSQIFAVETDTVTSLLGDVL